MNSWQVNTTASIATLLIHGVIIYFAVVGWQLTTPAVHKVPTIEYVKAELVTLKPKITAKPAPKPKAKPVAVKQPVKPKPVIKKEAPVKPEPKVEPKPQKIDQGALQREQLKKMQLLLAEEEAQIAAEAEALQLLNEDAQIANSYAGVIRQRIVSSWSRPPSARNSMEVTIAMQLTPNGQVVDVQVIKKSGDAAYDRSAIRAIKQIEKFPEIKDMPSRIFEAEFRNLVLVFRPEDLLL